MARSQCPDCETWFTGYKCNCGYVIPRNAAPAVVRPACGVQWCREDAEVRDAAGTLLCLSHARERVGKRAEQYLIGLGLFTPDTPAADRMRNLADFRTEIAAARPVKGIVWAQRVMTRMQDGDEVPIYVEKLAKEAIRRRQSFTDDDGDPF